MENLTAKDVEDRLAELQFLKEENAKLIKALNENRRHFEFACELCNIIRDAFLQVANFKDGSA